MFLSYLNIYNEYMRYLSIGFVHEIDLTRG